MQYVKCGAICRVDKKQCSNKPTYLCSIDYGQFKTNCGKKHILILKSNAKTMVPGLRFDLTLTKGLI